MTVWYKVAWIDPLFAAFNAIAPGRGHAEDGTIGDLAHAQGVSGHNPDDTPGVQAERQDADTKPEVRAADVDVHLNSTVTMEQCVQAVLHAPPAERDRLIYVIYNRRIWRKSNGWRQETYTGSDPHDQHAHFSGDPAADDNNAPWTSILALGDDMNLTDTVPDTGTPATKGAARNVGNILHDQQQRRSIEIGELPLSTYPADSPYRKLLEAPAVLAARLDAIDAKLAAATPAAVSDEQAAAMADRIAAVLVARPDNPLGDADQPAIVSAVKQALREGVAGA